ncbi:MAG: DNA-directed RNA polymerase subunit alpha [Candidatus Pacebacteria bacterium]|nr:DNA-directed RNA polymerase subunit alpha [Candidatus Paceibacterota bacterium]MBP9867260.1 DNA-directed RNA polymerase subunit alpha [Candidatus Paceibacterota bacterium]
MSSHSIILPSKPRIVKEDAVSGVYEIDGLYPGYGHTLGNSLRRIILSSIPGASITSLSIDGVKHEFSAITGIKEDVIAIILNLKKTRFKLHGDDMQKATLHIKGSKTVTAADITLPTQLEIMNKDQYICESTAKDVDLAIELTVEKGLGYVPREVLVKDKADIGTIALDASFTPIRRASYEVENMRVGDRTDHNRLRVSIETDGTVTPHEVLEDAIHTMITQLQSIVGFREKVIEMPKEILQTPVVESSDSLDLTDASKVKIEDLGLSTRTENALVTAAIRTAGGLARKSEEDLLAADGLGEKGITEIKKALSDLGLSLKA